MILYWNDSLDSFQSLSLSGLILYFPNRKQLPGHSFCWGTGSYRWEEDPQDQKQCLEECPLHCGTSWSDIWGHCLLVCLPQTHSMYMCNSHLVESHVSGSLSNEQQFYLNTCSRISHAYFWDFMILQVSFHW